MELKKIEVKNGVKTLEVPYYEFVGKKDGPSVFISAGMHGNEINGVYLVGKFIEWTRKELQSEKLGGRILIFPVLNPEAFSAKSRVSPVDWKDLNRQFNIESPGSISEQLAYDLRHKYFKSCQMGIDIHDSGNYAVYTPHARIHISDEDNCVSCTRNMARIFGTEYILEREGDKRMMAVSLNEKLNTPVITVEIGGRQILHPHILDIGLKGIMNVLYSNGMLDGSLNLPKKQYLVSNRYLVRSLKSGFITFKVDLGQHVQKGEIIGEMYYPIEQESVYIKSPIDGRVFSIWADNQVKSGVNICSFITDKKDNSVDLIEFENFSIESIKE